MKSENDGPISCKHLVEFPIRKPMGLLTQSAGVPQVITSIIGNPNGSGQSMGTPLYVGFSDMPLVSISNAQRKPDRQREFGCPGSSWHPCPPA